MRMPTAALLLACSAAAAAAPPVWLPDPGFGDNGVTTLEIEPGMEDYGRAQVIVSDEQRRLYVAGNAVQDGTGCLALARLLPDGQLDAENFGEGGTRCLGALFEGGSRLVPTDALVQPGGKLVVAGYDVVSEWPVICRFDSSGQLDIASFGSSATPGCAVLEDLTVRLLLHPGAPELRLDNVSIAADDTTLRVVVTVWNGVDTSAHLARTTADGAIVPFGQSVSTLLPLDNYFFSDVALADDGMLVLAGNKGVDFGNFFVAVADPDTGELDPGFHAGEALTFGFTDSSLDVPTAIALTPEGNIVVAGASGDSIDEMRPAVALVTRQGQFLPSFHNGAPAKYDPCVFYFGDCEIYVTGVEVLSGGKLLLGGYALKDGKYSIYTMRLNADGMPDASYGPNFPGQQGYAPLPGTQSQAAYSMLLQDGQPVLAGWRDMGDPNGLDFFVTRLSDGSLFGDGFETQP